MENELNLWKVLKKILSIVFEKIGINMKKILVLMGKN
jgi:hypothetical protein